MKKRLLPILFASVLMLAGCQPAQDNVPTLNSLNITNKEELGAVWCVGDDDRYVEVVSDPVLNYTTEFTPKGKLRLESSDNDVISYDGVGNALSAKKAGKATISVTYYGKKYDSVELTVSANRPEPQAKSATLREIYQEATTKSSNLDHPTQKYLATFTIDSLEYDPKGFMMVYDNTRNQESAVQLYESSKNMEFNWVSPGKYEYTNPKDFDKDEQLMNLEPGDTVTGEFIAFCYGAKVSGFELIGKITSVAKADRPAATSIAIQNKDAIEAYEFESGKLEAVVGPEGASALVDWEVTNGTGKAAIDNKGNIAYSQAGTVTVTATARGTSISDSVVITIKECRDKGFVGAPVAGGTYKMSFLKNDAHYYYTGEVQSNYYGKSSKKYSEATDVTVEAIDGGFALSHTFEGNKRYLGSHEGGGHINFKWDLTEPKKLTWDDEYHTFIIHDVPDGETAEKEYFFCTDTTNSSNSFRAIEVEGNLGGTRYVPIHLHSEEPDSEEEQLEEINVTRALEIIAALGDNETTTKEYIVTGFVVYKGNAWDDSSKYKNANFAIADDKNETDRSKELTVFRYANKEIFDSLVKNETKVKVTCTLTKYVKDSNVTPETNENPTVVVIPAN